jgi:hypothetical protein
MRDTRFPVRRRSLALVAALAALVGPASILAVPAAVAKAPGSGSGGFAPGDLLVTTGVWTTNADITAGSTQLPPNCPNPATAFASCGTAVAPGTYPLVFNNDGPDGSFGVTQPIVLDEIDPQNGQLVQAVTVPDNPANGDYLTTSFSSKSELSINQSTDDQYDTFAGYVAPPATIDASNGNTPGVLDPTISDTANATYRAVGQVNAAGQLEFTETNAFSGDNPRAAVLDPKDDTILAAGNAGNGANPEPPGVVSGAGAQLITPATVSEAKQMPGQPTPIGSFDAFLQDGAAAGSDKVAKDNNYRGMAVYDNVLYYVKGSGSNGVDTVYFVDTSPSQSACPKSGSTGTGLPVAGSPLPTTPPAFTDVANEGGKKNDPGLDPENMCILKGFPTVLVRNEPDADTADYPFGIWFANPDTLYVADEGAGAVPYDPTSGTYPAAAADPAAGLQKWSFDSSTGEWQLDYVLQNGLNLGQLYHVAKDSNGDAYPMGLNNTDGGTGLPWTPATDGLRNLTGRVNPDGTVSLWASTSTVSGSGDIGADPNRLVEITDDLAATTPSQVASEQFQTVLKAIDGQVVRGVAFTPGTPLSNGDTTG